MGMALKRDTDAGAYSGTYDAGNHESVTAEALGTPRGDIFLCVLCDPGVSAVSA